jgi:integrase
MHDARHAFGMLARMSRASIPEIQHALGHSNPGVTATYIRQIAPENQLKLVNEIFNQLANDRRKAGD